MNLLPSTLLICIPINNTTAIMCKTKNDTIINIVANIMDDGKYNNTQQNYKYILNYYG